MVDAELTNFVIVVSSITTAFVLSLVAAISKCMLRSRCTNIRCGCLSCDRDVISETNSIYNTPQNSEKEFDNL